MYGGLLSAALSMGSRPPGITWHLVLWSPDFPLTNHHASDRLADSTKSVLSIARYGQCSFVCTRARLARYFSGQPCRLSGGELG